LTIVPEALAPLRRARGQHRMTPAPALGAPKCRYVRPQPVGVQFT
jgi:hypothetical protein